MFTVALIGPDGSGKTTVARRLEQALPVSVKYLYMGINPASSNHALPTTRLAHAVKRFRGAKPDTAGPRDPRTIVRRPPGGPRRRLLSALRALLRLVNRMAEEWHRQLVASVHLRRGSIVVFDRHFLADYYAYDVAGGVRRPLSRRLHGFFLSRMYPRPDLVIYLDAPAEVLFKRKGEGSLQSLTRRRREYLDLAGVMSNFRVVDASRPVDEVTDDVIELIEEFSAGRRLGAPSS
jgi:thymidylate kinase